MPFESLFHNADKTRTVAAGEAVFTEGDGGADMFGLIEGRIELRKGALTVATLGPGDVFGEMALIDLSPRSLTAIATADSTLAVIDRHLFLFLVHETPTFALHVMGSLASRIRDYDEGLAARQP
jgi:CRP/FNR family cyclic AMP-dependent transcriptional regulator